MIVNLYCRAVLVPFDESTSVEGLAHYAKESGCSIIFASTAEQEAKIIEAWHGLPDLATLITTRASPLTANQEAAASAELRAPSAAASGAAARQQATTLVNSSTSIGKLRRLVFVEGKNQRRSYTSDVGIMAYSTESLLPAKDVDDSSAEEGATENDSSIFETFEDERKVRLGFVT